MKKLTLIALLFISLGAFAQSKFIEVEVTDTIALKPLSYRCNLYVDTYDYDMVVEAEPVGDDNSNTVADAYDPLAAEEKAKNKIEAFKSSLELKKFKVMPLDESNVLEKRAYDQKGFTVIANSVEELKALNEIIGARQDVTVSVSVLKYADEKKAEETLIKRLIERAKAKAALIGASSGLKPGRIIEVKEGRPSGEQSLTELYSQILKMSAAYGKEMDISGSSLSKTFVVKFVAE